MGAEYLTVLGTSLAKVNKKPLLFSWQTSEARGTGYVDCFIFLLWLTQGCYLGQDKLLSLTRSEQSPRILQSWWSRRESERKLKIKHVICSLYTMWWEESKRNRRHCRAHSWLVGRLVTASSLVALALGIRRQTVVKMRIIRQWQKSTITGVV